jgi:uncharacterized membrane protein YfcA
MFDLTLLACAAFVAGLVDAVVGGGGLIQIPAIFAVYPKEVPATLLGTNKLAAVFGTGGRGRQIFAPGDGGLEHGGARRARRLCPVLCRRLDRDPGAGRFRAQPAAADPGGRRRLHLQEERPGRGPRADAQRHDRALLAIGIGSAIGFYDGFFGPGTGSFLIFLFVRFFGFDFLSASAASKIVNVACNISALIWFGVSGHLIWQLGLMMAVCQIAGSLVGTRLALKHGSGFVRNCSWASLDLAHRKDSLGHLPPPGW